MLTTQANSLFDDLFVLDLANNHQGDVAHGARIIEECAAVVAKHGVRAGIKMQFRDLPHFVHQDERRESSNKHVSRFLSTHMDWPNYQRLLELTKKHNLLSICTPFDERSAERIKEFGFDIIKVASCSANDWPLLESVVATGLPIIASTGGLQQHEVDDLVSFLTHQGCKFALMHCVSIYPTPDAECNLGNIAAFRDRYPNRVIGWSTHEPPAETTHVGLAYALGARMMERHVGVPTDTISLNAYSATPQEIDDWIAAWARARVLIGNHQRGAPTPIEKDAIAGLRRGVFAKRPIRTDEPIGRDDVYFAFPYRPGQLASSDWRAGVRALAPIEADAPLNPETLSIPADPEELIIKKAIHEVKAILSIAKIPLSHEFSTEYSHHYGISKFRSTGAVLITVVNRDYAKKIIVQLPGQMHPWHFHKLKEETFVMLYGDLTLEIEDRKRQMQPGDTLTVLPGVWHRFWSDTGCVFEEISSAAVANDSVYRDPQINALTSAQRKTVVDHWGRFQITEQLRRPADASAP